MLVFINGCFPSSPAAPRFDANRFREDRLTRLAPTVDTNKNIFDVQFVADYAPDALTKQVADDRVLQLIGEAESLRDMLLFAVQDRPSTHSEDARIRAEYLIRKFRGEGQARISDLFEAVFSPSQYNYRTQSQTISNVLQSPLEATIIATTKEVITNAYDRIAEDDFSHDFSFEGEVLPSLVAKIKINYRYSAFQSVNILYSIVEGQGRLTVNPDETYGRIFAPSTTTYTGVSRDTFKTAGLSYERWRYGTSGIVREFIRRESTSTGRAVATEVITWDGIHYRKSTIEGF
jgi:hypothetical protein